MFQQFLSRRFCNVLIIAALLTLSACKDSAEAPPAPIAAASQESLVAGGFYVRSLQSAVYDSDAALELNFSETLATEQDFGTLLTVLDSDKKAVDGGWTLDYDDPRVLRFHPVKSGADYNVQVSREILSSTGAKFTNDYQSTIKGVEQAPVFGFSGAGSLLPARASEGLPIRTVNVGEVDVEFLRVNDDALSHVLRERAFRGRKGGWELANLKRYTQSVYSNRFEISDARRNEQVVSLLPIQTITELQRSGLYFAIMRRPGDFDSYFEVTHYVVSDIGVHVRKYQNQVLMMANSLATGKALSGVKFTVINPFGQEVLQGESDASGQLMATHQPKAEELLLARSGEELTVLPFNQPALDLSEFEITGATSDAISLHMWSGRDLYRPGEELRFFALLRDFDGKPLPNQDKLPIYANLRQPDGKIYASASLQADQLGFLQWQRSVPADAPVGKWKLEMGSDPEGKGRVHSFNFRVEEFLPERLKLEMSTSEERFAKGDVLRFDVLGSFLYGAPASGNRFAAKYVLGVDTEAVSKLKGYLFGDQVNKPKSEALDVIDQSLDDAGKLTAEIKVDPAIVNGPISVAVVGQLFESGGRAVTRVLKRSIWPAEQLIGVRPMFADHDAGGNSTARFEIALSNAAGEMLAGKAKVKLIRERRDYRWSYKSGLGWVSDYVESLSESGNQELNLVAGKALSVEFPVEWGNYRLEVEDPNTSLVTRYGFYAGWSWGDDNTGPDARPDKVKLALDKSAYRVGDEVQLTVTAPDAGEGVLFVESNALLQTQRFSAGLGSVVKVKILPEWDRHDVYLSAIVFKPGDNGNHITPKRAIGMIHLPMDRQDRQLQVLLKAPDKMQPMQALQAQIEVTEAGGKALAGKKANLTLHAVDQGITNITDFKVPSPFKSFFAKRAYAQDLYDVYGRIIESLPGTLAKLRFGGDGLLANLPQAKRDTAKVETVDLYSGVVTLDAQGKASIPLKVADFNGSLKVSAVVFTDDAYGFADQETIVRAPIVAEVSMPRVMAPEDSSNLNLEVTNFTERDGEFQVQLVSSKGLAFDGAKQTIALKNGAKATLNFPVRATGVIGVAKYSVQVSGNDLRMERKFETVVRPAWSQQYLTRFEQIGAGQDIPLSQDLSGFFASTVASRVAVSTRAPIPVADAAKQLFDYPYGCIEQTSSKLMPYVALDAKTAQQLGLSEKFFDNREEKVAFALGRIASMQAENGHFNYWPGGSDPEPSLTPFVTEILQDASEQGFTMPPNVLQKAQERLKESLLSGGEVNYSRSYNNNTDHLRLSYNAHAGYVLSRVNQAPLGSLRSIYDSQAKNALSPLPLVRLGIALKSAGDQKRGDAAIALALGEKWAMDGNRWLGDYGSVLRDHALSLALLSEARLSPADADARLLEVIYQARDSEYLSTQERMSLVELGKQFATGAKPLAGELSFDADKQSFNTQGLFSADLSANQMTQSPQLSVQQGPVFLMQNTVGIPKRAPQPKANEIAIRRTFYTLNGQPFSGQQIREGERLVVELSVESKVWTPDTLMVDLLPGGLEVENLNLLPPEQLSGIKIGDTTLSDARSMSGARNEEFRDDRYVLAAPTNQGTSRYFYLVRAVSPGNYVVPPPAIEDMYRPSLNNVGVSIPERIEVLPGG